MAFFFQGKKGQAKAMSAGRAGWHEVAGLAGTEWHGEEGRRCARYLSMLYATVCSTGMCTVSTCQFDRCTSPQLWLVDT